MSSNPGFSGRSEPSFIGVLDQHHAGTNNGDGQPSMHSGVNSAAKMMVREARPLSAWSVSIWKRVFDVACVLGTLPVTVPVFLITGLAVRLTSQGPVLFRQQRMGRNGQAFTILKFRTMPVRRSAANRPSVTTSINQRFTPVGATLRRWKLDELPQLVNVVRGEMSVVGPRPKLADHQTSSLNCRPGITGRATIVFAREEMVLSPLPSSQLDGIYHKVVLPLKHQLDQEYMAHATLMSDVKLIVNSVFRKWEDLELRHLVQMHPEFASQARKPAEKSAITAIPIVLTHQQAPLRSEFQAD